jgi:plasmid replication initiation protein
MKDKGDHGRDSMNLAEMPITLLTDKMPKGVHTIVFKAEQGQVSILASGDLGLPTAIDSDVLVGLITIAKRTNDFADPTVNFTRYELLDLLGWKKDGRNYRRVDDSLRRWVGTTLRYENSWYDNAIKKKVDASFHILESVTIHDVETKQPGLPFSTFRWGQAFFDSCRSSYLKKLDIDLYVSLRGAIPRRIYRLMDKRFYVRDTWTFPLRAFAFENVGISRNYTDSKIREVLKPALTELVNIGFFTSATYASPKRGTWTIRLVGKSRVGKAGDS